MAAFGFGVDDQTIGGIDARGVALAAIQGLHQLVLDKDARIAAAQERRIATLESALDELRRSIAALPGRLQAA